MATINMVHVGIDEKIKAQATETVAYVLSLTCRERTPQTNGAPNQF